MIKKLHFKALLLMATLVFGVGNVWGDDTYTLVKSASELSEGDVILITSSKTNGTVVKGLMGAQSGNNCPGVDVTISDEKITSLGEGQEITLAEVDASGNFSFKVDATNYLYAASGSSNYLKKRTTVAYWSVAINGSTYAATIQDETNTDNRRLLRYNTQSKLFSCYSSGQADVYVFKKVVAPAQTITVVSNNDAWGTVSLLGTTITASPKSGYRVVAGDGGYTVTDGTATVVNNGDNTFTVTPSTDCTVRINFEAIPTHKANFSVNGAVSSNDVQEGADIDFPADPADLGGKKFVGWAAAPISGTTDEEPAFVSSTVMGNADVTYYAVFATLTPGDAETFVDELTLAETGVSGTTYTEWSDVTVTSVAVYAGQSAGGNDAIQLRSNNENSGIVTTTSGGKVKKVVLTWNSNTASGRTVNVYGSNTAYTDATDLYDGEKQGTELGTIVNGTSTELNINGDYAYVGLRSASGALYLDEVAITWETGTPDAYSAYCTSITVPVTITDAGFATYCSAYALDFSGVDGLTAYQAGMEGTTVEFTEVSDVPAETGVLVKGAAATYNVPVVASSSTDVSDNVLVGTVTATTIDGTNASTDFFVLKKNTAGVGFYRVTNDAYNVRANSAYLAVAKGSAKGFIPVDGTTAIDLVDTANEVAAPAYNLQGQRVSNGYKGVVIVNGKKIIK